MIDSVAVIRAHRAGGLAAATATVAVVLAISAAGATASTPPSSTVPLSPGGVMAGPDGGFEVQFSAAPIVITDPAGTSTSYLARVDEDTETVSVVPPTAFGAASEASATDRVALFLDASGDGIDVLANTPTRLGPLPAAYFISRITLADGNRAVLYGAVVVRPGDVNYVVYTDIGGDDADRARHFVESYTAVIAPPPPTAPPTTSVVRDHLHADDGAIVVDDDAATHDGNDVNGPLDHVRADDGTGANDHRAGRRHGLVRRGLVDRVSRRRGGHLASIIGGRFRLRRVRRSRR